MDEMTLNILGRCLRYLLYSHLCHIFVLYLMYRACGMRQFGRRWYGAYIALLELRLLASVLILEVLEVFHGEEAWYPLLEEAYSLFYCLIGIVVLAAYQGPLGKKIFAMVWLEAIVVGCQMMAWNLAYWGTGEVYVMSGQPLRIRDAWMTLLYMPLCALCSAALSSALRFYRGHHFRHPRLLLGLGLMITFRRVYVNLFAAAFQSAYLMTADLVLCEVTLVLLVVLLMRRARLWKEIFREQQRSVEAHMRLLREQAAWVTESRARLEEQISMVESLSREGQGGPAEAYLAELKEQYRSFLAGIRCKDQMVDALLCYKEGLCRQQGISTEFSLGQYDRGSLEEREVAALLWLLFDRAVQSCQQDRGEEGHISLRMALVKGQFLVEMGYSGRQKMARGNLCPILSRHDGVLLQKRTDTGRQAKVLLQASLTPERHHRAADFRKENRIYGDGYRKKVDYRAVR